MIKRWPRWLFAAFLCISLPATAQLPADVAKNQADAMNRLGGIQPGVQFLGQGAGLERVYGPAFGGGSTAEDAFRGFIEAYSDLFALGQSHLEYQGEQPLMYGTFVAGTFKQYLGSYPVDRGQVTLLVKSQIGFPMVLAVNGAKMVKGPIAPPSIGATAAQRALKAVHPTLRKFETPSLVIWVGEDRAHLAWTFIGSSPTSLTGCTSCGSIPERVEAFVDAHTGKVLEERQAIWTIDVNGTVSAWATPGLKPDQANNPETLQALGNLRVNITGGNSAFTGANGTYSIANAGSTAVTVNAPLTGRWVNVVNQAGSTMALSQNVTPPGPADFIFNLAQDQFSTAQTNGYVQTNRIHDFVKSVNPAYPGIDLALPCNVNVSGSCNAFFNGSSINFYQAQAGGTGCPNMAYSTVVWHEYGHFVVNRGGTNQGAYGEGMSDTIANLCGDTPWTGEDFSGPNTGPLRSAINNVTYPSAAEIHTAGMIVSGAFWMTLLQLDGTVGHTNGLSLVRQWAINSILLHPPAISPGMTVDVLTLDDNDGDITNGTPHYAEISAGFGAKRLFAPPVKWVNLNPVVVPPDFVSFDSIQRSLNLLFEVLPNTGTPNISTLRAFVRWNGANWQELDMQLKGTNRYNAVLKRPPSGTVVDWYVQCADTQGRVTRYPLDATATLKSYVVANGLVTVVEDFCDSLGAWSVANTSLTAGAWTVGNPIGTNLNGMAANPENDSADTGANCFFTGQGTAGGAVGEQDVDGGPTVLTSPAYNIGGNDAIIEFKRWFFNDDFDADAMVVQVSTDGGATWFNLETVTGLQNSWVQRSFRLGQYAPLGPTVMLRFSVSDNPNDSITEAAVDHVVVKRIVP